MTNARLAETLRQIARDAGALRDAAEQAVAEYERETGRDSGILGGLVAAETGARAAARVVAAWALSDRPRGCGGTGLTTPDALELVADTDRSAA